MLTLRPDVARVASGYHQIVRETSKGRPEYGWLPHWLGVPDKTVDVTFALDIFRGMGEIQQHIKSSHRPKQYRECSLDPKTGYGDRCSSDPALDEPAL